jgi:hypothetical protein
MINQNQELLFIFAGITYVGTMLLILAVLAGIRRRKATKPKCKLVAIDLEAVELRTIAALSTREGKAWKDQMKRWSK